tara:strand:+ start:176 stop:1018 length:843 start_codon:yes stop_codon:yes gene_type:complete
MKLSEHREILKNSRDFTTDLTRCKKTLINHLRCCGYYNLPEKILNRFVDLIFTAQQEKPFFFHENKEGTPAMWNSPRDWDKKHYRYEWGHLRSRNQNGFEADKVENLALLSARGNQHIQSSLDIDEVMEIFEGSQLEKTASENLDRRMKLFSSTRWELLMKEMQAHWAPTGGKNVSNDEVLECFTNHTWARSGALHTNTNNLYSYNRVISYIPTHDEGCVHIHNYTSKSMEGVVGQKSSKTTATHVTKLIRHCKKNNKNYKIIPGENEQTFKRKRGSLRK